jgi:anaerobic selenocysteine-containing dehydrogenase
MRMANILCAGTMGRSDIANTDLLIGWGYNPFYSGVFCMDQIDLLREKGMKLLVIDPKLTPTAQLADLHLQIKAGSDGALALYFGNYLIAHNAIDRDYIENHVHGYQEYAEYVKQFPVERAAQITGESAEKLEKAAQMLVDNPRFTSQIGSAPLTHHRNGVQNMRAILALSGITGNYDREGGNLPTQFADKRVNRDCDIGDHDFIQEVRPQNTKPKIGAQRFPVWAQTIDEFQAMDLPRQILEGTPYPIRGVFALGMNARMFPGNDKLFQALEQVEFFADVDIFMNKTAQYADIVLPACTSFERSQFQGGFMGHYLDLRAVRYLPPAIKPLYQSKSDADILCELSAYLDMDDPLLERGYDACTRRILRKVGVTLSELETSRAATRIPGKEPYFPGDNTKFGYPTPTGKFELTSEVLRANGFDPLPTWTPSEDDAPVEDYPFLLTAGGRLPYHFHSRFQNSSIKQVFRPESMADLNPKDARRLKLRQGSPITVETAYGAIHLKANLTYAMAEGSVYIYQDYPDADVNSIIPPDHLDPISGFPGYRSVRCAVRKEQEGGRPNETAQGAFSPV